MSQLLDLIKRHEGFRKDAYWDKTGQGLWQGFFEHGSPGLRSTPKTKQKLGHLTIGYGFNLEAGMSQELAGHILEWHIQQALATARKYEWWPELGDNRPPAFTEPEPFSPRQAVIVSMIHQLGPTGFAGFKRMIAHIQVGVSSKDSTYAAWSFAGDEMEDSAWHSQTPRRCEELAKMMRTGEWP